MTLSVRQQMVAIPLAITIVGLEQRLAKGWDYLDEHPSEDRPGQRSYDLWLSLLTEYQDRCGEFARATGRRWSLDTRTLAHLDEGDL